MPPTKRIAASISVKSHTGTYTARCQGKTASASAGWEQAAQACAVKLMPGIKFELERLSDSRQFYRTYLATPKD